MKRPEINPLVTRTVADSLTKLGSGEVRRCCCDPANLLPDEADDDNFTALLRCRVCYRGHRYMLAESGELGCMLSGRRQHPEKSVFLPLDTTPIVTGLL
jgi:hypothetical protein